MSIFLLSTITLAKFISWDFAPTVFFWLDLRSLRSMSASTRAIPNILTTSSTGENPDGGDQFIIIVAHTASPDFHLFCSLKYVQFYLLFAEEFRGANKGSQPSIKILGISFLARISLSVCMTTMEAQPGLYVWRKNTYNNVCMCPLKKIRLTHRKKKICYCLFPGPSGSFVEINDISNCFLGTGVCLDIHSCLLIFPPTLYYSQLFLRFEPS